VIMGSSLTIGVYEMLLAFDRILPVLCFAVIMWPFATCAVAFPYAIFVTLTGIAIAPAFAAYSAIPLAIYWASKVWAA